MSKTKHRMTPADRLATKAEQAGEKRVGISIVRRYIKGMEKSYIWQAGVLHCPEGKRLIQPLRQPWMNFTEGREVLSEILGKEPRKIAWLSVPGGKTYFPSESEMEILFEDAPPPEEPEEPAQDPVAEIDFESMRSTF